jgi:hypothetical protein
LKRRRQPWRGKIPPLQKNPLRPVLMHQQLKHTTLCILSAISGLIVLCQSWVTSRVAASTDSSLFQYYRVNITIYNHTCITWFIFCHGRTTSLLGNITNSLLHEYCYECELSTSNNQCKRQWTSDTSKISSFYYGN